jgi:hypothetical protein
MKRRACPKPEKSKKPKVKKVAASGVLALWREVCLRHAGNKCEFPNCTVNYKYLNPHHYYARGNKSVKYDPMNSVCLCSYHHTLGTESAHLNPDWKEIWLASGKRPAGWLEELTRRKNLTVKDNDEYRAMWKGKLKWILEMGG